LTHFRNLKAAKTRKKCFRSGTRKVSYWLTTCCSMATPTCLNTSSVTGLTLMPI